VRCSTGALWIQDFVQLALELALSFKKQLGLNLPKTFGVVLTKEELSPINIPFIAKNDQSFATSVKCPAAPVGNFANERKRHR
jgi:hypothetical protein